MSIDNFRTRLRLTDLLLSIEAMKENFDLLASRAAELQREIDACDRQQFELERAKC